MTSTTTRTLHVRTNVRAGGLNFNHALRVRPA
jgi:hypothetical protein